MTLTAIYTSSVVVDVKKYVSVRVPIDEGNFACKLFGIPPHVANLAAISGFKDEMTRIAPTLLKITQTVLMIELLVVFCLRQGWRHYLRN